MSIYKGLLMLEGYLTHVERVEDAPCSRDGGATESRPVASRRPSPLRAVPAPEPVVEEPGCAAGGCC
ncbi:hypothetical protein JY651_03030 [Pyxidicoccus parkwayensis]|uniref:Uncharacterized protein n=1 Tax=Pyxidicoccus parkwayensis TaxID=2813578 RepID=A0ABX7NYH1_9BACT|nr:hypothetical protein [Pyxidicoccus parkwaysis]QSQ23970.1 hypothetical protein JY651_03030 [Pyxidicoccus parkwaysis]